MCREKSSTKVRKVRRMNEKEKKEEKKEFRYEEVFFTAGNSCC